MQNQKLNAIPLWHTKGEMHTCSTNTYYQTLICTSNSPVQEKSIYLETSRVLRLSDCSWFCGLQSRETMERKPCHSRALRSDIYIYIHTHTHLYMCVCVCYVCIYISIYKAYIYMYIQHKVLSNWTVNYKTMKETQLEKEA